MRLQRSMEFEMSTNVKYDTGFDFPSYIEEKRKLIEERLDQYLTPDEEDGILWDSMRYSVLSGGKRLRAVLCLSAAQLVEMSLTDRTLEIEDSVELALPCACAIEMVHAMSLIHDDLPALDNDEIRRGKPTNHKVFGDAIALLAGDALLMLANQILIEETPRSVDSDTLLSVVAELAKATGPDGMVGGQVADMLFTGCASAIPAFNDEEMLQRAGLNRDEIRSRNVASGELSEAAMESIHRGKTGCLIRFAVWSGAKLVGANTDQLSKLSDYGEILGLAFQIADDLLDVTGDAKTLGKTPGKDEAAQKATWVRLFGVEGAQHRLRKLEARGLTLLAESGLAESGRAPLKALLQYAIHRSH